MDVIQVVVTRHSRYGTTSDTEEAFAAPGLDRMLIREHLMEQASEFHDSEILEGRSFGGIYVDPDSGSWIYVMEHTDGIEDDIGADASTEQINEWLYEKFTNVGSGRSNYDGEPASVELIPDAGQE